MKKILNINYNSLYKNFSDRCKRWYKKYIKAFLFILSIGLLAHTFSFTNKLLNHDELNSLFSKGATFSIGRWGLELISCIFNNVSTSWSIGVFTLILIAISACIISEIYNVKSNMTRVLIGGLMVTFPSITGTFMYMFTASSYAVAIFLSVLSVYLCNKNKWYFYILSIVFIVFSLSLYQAYISISASLLLLLLILEVKKEKSTIKGIVNLSIKYFLVLFISLICYFVITQLVNSILNISFTSYQNVDKMGNININYIIIGIEKAYMAPILLFKTGWNGILFNDFLKILYVLICIFDFIIILTYINKIRKTSFLKVLLVILFVLILPISMNILYILNPGIDMHSLIIYGNIVIFIFPFLLYEDIKMEKYINNIKKISYIIVICIIFQYITLANECYTRLYLAYENTYAFYNTLVTRIMSHEEFDDNTKIALIGKYNGELLNNTDKYFINTLRVTGINNSKQLINSYSNKEFIENYIGLDFDFASDAEIEELIKTEEYKNMKTYPYKNSIKIINNILVVKY